MKVIAEFVCSPNRKEIYDQKLIFLSNSIIEDEVSYTDSVYDYITSSYFWDDIFPENEKGLYKLVLQLQIKGHSYYSHYFGEDEYEEEVTIEEIMIKDQLKNISEVRYIAEIIKKDNEGANQRFKENDN